ncbi:MAG: RDD family protein [Blastocatellia bacterium]|nr:RDD family protein [Blastocatellia bacterium]
MHKEERPSGRDRSESASARPPTKGITLSSEPARQESRSNYHIADAALARVRRASEKARRDRLPRIDAPRTEPTTKRTITADYQATARALEPAIEIELSPAPIIEPSPAPTAAAAAPARSKSVTTVRKELPRVETESSIYPLDSPATSDTAIDDPLPSTALEEIEPCDYLEAEVRKFGHLLVADESEATEIPPRSVHFTITFIDLFVIAASSTPFLALVEILNGDFADSATWISSAMIVLLVAFFYLAITQCLCGKTFGMMLTNTRVVEAKTQEPPTVARALLRAAAYFADLPFLVGLLWPLTNRRHRGLQDYLSGTLVARDY